MAPFMKRAAFGALTLSAILCTITAEVQWSEWYNSDKPVYGSGVDDETLKRVSMVFSMPCRLEEVREVQCRPAGSREEGTWFAQQALYNLNVLYVPCNRTGLVCRNQDQYGENISCADYEIRVSCLAPDNNQSGGVPHDGANQENSNNNNNNLSNNLNQGELGSSGGFIAMAAGGSVVLPLVCVLFVQLRKSRREERRRAEQARQAAEDLAAREAAARTADAPPAYDDLFGAPETVSVISSTSLDSGVALDFQPGGSSAERLANGQPGREGAGARGTAANQRGTTPRVLSSSLSNSSSLSSASSSSSSPIAGTVVSSASPVSDLNVHRSTSSTPATPSSSPSSSSPSPPPSASDARRTSTTSSASSVSSVSSSVPLLPPSSSRAASSSGGRHHVIHHDPPPAYDAVPGHANAVRSNGPAHVTVVLPGMPETVLDLSESSPPSSPPSSSESAFQPPPPLEQSSGGVTRRRFLGMHLSIFDLMAVIYPDPSPSPPPPSYDDALKILNLAPSSSTSSQQPAGS